MCVLLCRSSLRADRAPLAVLAQNCGEFGESYTLRLLVLVAGVAAVLAEATHCGYTAQWVTTATRC